MPRVTPAHIAEGAGVSQATVSRVLNGRAAYRKIKPETEHTVLAQAKKLGYCLQRKIYKPHTEYFAHPVTTVTQPVIDMAPAAVDLLMDEMNSHERKPAMRVQLPTTLVRRNSVKILNSPRRNT
jgi:DNA-binding LacI/PurR family transcriptional regulator